MNRYARFSRVIPNSGGQYDTDSATVHLGNGNFTLCGHRIRLTKNWQEVGVHWGVTCTACKREDKKRPYASW